MSTIISRVVGHTRKHPFLLLTLGLLVGGFVMYGWTYWRGNDYTFSGADKTKYIANYETAPDTLRKTLINQYYDEKKSLCIQENKNVSTEVRIADIMYIHNVVDNIAAVQFCGSGATTLLSYEDGVWKEIGDLGDYPTCDFVKEYSISEKIIDKCYKDTNEVANVNAL